MDSLDEILRKIADAATSRTNMPTSSSTERREDADVCPICRGTGWVVPDVPVNHPDFGKAIPCRCRAEEIARRRRERLRAISHISALEHMRFDTFIPDGIGIPEPQRLSLRAAYEIARKYAERPEGWLVLLGNYGCGKTHLAAAIANYRLDQGDEVLFLVVPDLLDYLRSTFAPTSETAYDERFEMIRQVPLLILDDLGAQATTPWAQEKLFQIFNYRYNARLPTVITSNLRLEDIEVRVRSRLADPTLVQIVTITAPDFRRAGVEHTHTELSTLSLHTDQTFDTFDLREDELSHEEVENLRRALRLAKAYAEDPRGWLVFIGTYGCGKTHLAAAIAHYRTKMGPENPMFVVVPDLLDHLRATFGPNSAISYDKRFEEVKTTPLLVLDDLGTESATPWAREKLYQILNYRYVANLPTVITTSWSIDEIDPRLRTRMLDTTRCTVFVIEAPAYRGPRAKPSRGRRKR